MGKLQQIHDKRLIEGAKTLIDLMYTNGERVHHQPKDVLNYVTTTKYRYSGLSLYLEDILHERDFQILKLVRTGTVRFACGIEYRHDLETGESRCVVSVNDIKALETTMLEYQFLL